MRVLRHVVLPIAALLVLGCASNTVSRHTVTTRFILSDQPVPPAAAPFLSVLDSRPESTRRYRHDALDTYFGDENLAETLSDSLERKSRRNSKFPRKVALDW
jgi:hypothetical protein